MRKRKLALWLFPLLLATAPVLAQDAMDQKMQQANAKMEQDMRAGMQSGGSPDARFVKMMIPHHQGAVEMSQIALADIKDPELRRMVEKTIKENEHGIQEMNAWLKKHGQ